MSHIMSCLSAKVGENAVKDRMGEMITNTLNWHAHRLVLTCARFRLHSLLVVNICLLDTHSYHTC